MSDDPTPDPVPVGTTNAGSPEPAATSQPPPPAEPVNGLDEMSPDQLDALAQRIEQTRANRPKSVAQQLEEIQHRLAETGQQQRSKIAERDEAKSDVQELDATISELRATLRRTELIEAATAAGFKSPAVIADHLAGRDGDVTTLVTDLAGTGAFAMRAPVTSAPIGGPGAKPAQNVDAGRQGLIDEINAAHGRV